MRVVCKSLFFLVVIVGIFLSFGKSLDATDHTVPVVDTINTAIASGGSDQSSVNLVEDTTITLYIHGSASDADGCSDINTASNWINVIYRTNHASVESCTADNNDCYQTNEAADLALTSCSGTTLNYQQTDTIVYHADLVK